MGLCSGIRKISLNLEACRLEPHSGSSSGPTMIKFSASLTLLALGLPASFTPSER